LKRTQNPSDEALQENKRKEGGEKETNKGYIKMNKGYSKMLYPLFISIKESCV